VTGRHLEAAGGHVNELFFSRTEGYDNPRLTAEDVESAFDTIVDRARSAEVPDLEQAARSRFTPNPYRPPD
jgi:hypothetical protein